MLSPRAVENFSYERASSCEDVDTFLRDHEHDGQLLAGGTDLLVQMRSGSVTPRYVLDVKYVPGLGEVHGTLDGSLRVGAAVRLTTIANHDAVRTRCRALAEGAETVGSAQIQNMGTLVGNVCNASPAADTVPALLAYDAAINVRSYRGKRHVSAEEFFVGPGLTQLAPHEWVESVEIPTADVDDSSYVKLGRTRGVDIAIVGAAVACSSRGVRVGLASVAPTPLRARRTEAALSVPPEEIDWRDVEAAIVGEVEPVSDVRASAEYRMAMACECTMRAYLRATNERGIRPSE
jgi:carbon-monoxide dehydrogenase medium subunit